ncbi:MAG: hypothetical protein M1829_001199 [Trizodia sp. TS-e1964]|nr:MAG: hypothetical protein M1829_001199 [Trizodia sp. TS-e1964]
MKELDKPAALLSHLHHTDGSATYSHNGYTVVCAVNGPIEVPRRDEHPEEATIDVIIQPAIGIGGPRERLLESILLATLRHMIIKQNHPRSLIQVSLQVCSMPDMSSPDVANPQFSSNVLVLPALIQAAMLGLLSAAIPLSTTATATIVAADKSGNLVQDPSPDAIRKAVSVHVMAFNSEEKLILSESKGAFGYGEWSTAFELCKRTCCETSKDVDMDTGEVQTYSLQAYLRHELQKQIGRDMQWKEQLQ